MFVRVRAFVRIGKTPQTARHRLKPSFPRLGLPIIALNMAPGLLLKLYKGRKAGPCPIQHLRGEFLSVLNVYQAILLVILC